MTSDYTSGSTGEPVELRLTGRHDVMNWLEDRRLKQGWPFGGHRRILRLRIPLPDKPRGLVERRPLPNDAELWTLYDPEATAALQALRESGATWVSGQPSQTHDTLKLARTSGIKLPLRLVTTFGETIPPGFQALVRECGYKAVDSYGSTETSLIAKQCPLCGDYHLADRHLIFEVLRQDDSPAAPGELGEVVVTPLYNLAMPLLRYALGDYVELGPPACPRAGGLAIRRIAGRLRDMFKLPDGGRVMPMLPPAAVLELGLRKFKLVQTTLQDVELRYVPGAAGQLLSQEVAQRAVDRYVAHGFTVRPVPLADIPPDASGKYRMHESLVAE